MEQRLTRQNTGFVTVGEALVLAEHVADFPASHADITRGDIGVFTKVSVKLGHEGLAEPHDFSVRTAPWVEIGPTLAAADRHSGQRILEGLFEAEKFDDPDIYRRGKRMPPL